MTEDLEVFLRPTPAIESEHPEVAAFARERAAREARSSVNALRNQQHATQPGEL
jgi:hypothetical protein